MSTPPSCFHKSLSRCVEALEDASIRSSAGITASTEQAQRVFFFYVFAFFSIARRAILSSKLTNCCVQTG